MPEQPLPTWRVKTWLVEFEDGVGRGETGSDADNWARRLAETAEALLETRAALRGVSAYHYGPQCGGYCWCHADQRGAQGSHEEPCLRARAVLSPKEET